MIVLGMSRGQGGHDTSSAILVDGKLVAAAEEERFIREKWARDRFPINSSLYCLHEANLSPWDVDIVAFGFSHDECAKRIGDRPDREGLIRPILNQKKLWIAELSRIFLGQVPKTVFIDHHKCHATFAHFTSGYQRASILTLDAFGDYVTTTLGYGVENITTTHRLLIPHSIGVFYGSLTQYLGWHSPGQEGKVMGLAPYGKPVYDFEDVVQKTREGFEILKPDLVRFNSQSKWEDYFGRPSPNTAVSSFSKNIAASAQTKLEETAHHLVDILRENHSSKNLVISGGVAFNSAMNGSLLARDDVDSVFVPPGAGDSGNAIGAAFCAYQEETGKSPAFKMKHAYYGPQYDAEPELKKSGLKYNQVSEPEKFAAEALSEGKLLGWFQGRMEFGPRALGNRSILADPRDSKSKDIVNNRCKHREPWRPFAPSVLQSDMDKYFLNSIPSLFMTMVFKVRPEIQANIPSVVHVDGTSRPQTVSHGQYHDLISHFKKLTGEGMVLNTSFNLSGEPIVMRPSEALADFRAMDLDYLVMGNFLVEK